MEAGTEDVNEEEVAAYVTDKAGRVVKFLNCTPGTHFGEYKDALGGNEKVRRSLDHPCSGFRWDRGSIVS
jgi:hypothetical protein